MTKKVKSIMSVVLATLLIASLFAMPMGASAAVDNRITVNFEKPDDWGNDIYMYYYVDGGNNSQVPEWPGTKMTKLGADNSYIGFIYGLDEVRVMFTDGTKQTPGAFEPGIPAKASQWLIVEDGKYTVSDYFWIHVNQPTNSARVNEDHHVKIDLSEGNDFFLTFKDQDGNAVEPTGYTRTHRNGIYHYDYTFNFPTTGDKVIDVYYYYHSGTGYSGKSFTVDVQDTGSTGFTSDKYDVAVGETFTVKLLENVNYSTVICDENGEDVEPINFYHETVDGRTYRYMEFKLDEPGTKTLHRYIYNWRNPIYRMDTGDFVTINAWQNI